MWKLVDNQYHVFIHGFACTELTGSRCQLVADEQYWGGWRRYGCSRAGEHCNIATTCGWGS